MKFNIVTTFIALCLSALIAFGFYSFNDNALKAALCIGSFILISITLVMAIGIRFNNYRGNINIRATSVTFFVAALVSNLIFSFVVFSLPAYIVTHGILLLLYLLVVYLILKPKI
jgi:hypothetical protein